MQAVEPTEAEIEVWAGDAFPPVVFEFVAADGTPATGGNFDAGSISARGR